MSKDSLDDDIVIYTEENEDEDDLPDEDISKSKENFNLEISSSPLQARFYTGDSARPLQGQFNDSSYKDDLSKVWLGLLSYYG